MKERLRFLKVALGNLNVGAVVRSSRHVVNGVLKIIPKHNIKQIIEYGPGDGVLTRELLKRLAPDGKLLAVEIDPAFLKILNEINDPRLKVVKGTMQKISKDIGTYGFDSVDLVVSSVPFSYLTASERKSVTSNTEKALAPKGMFIVFHQYTPLMTLPMRKFFKKVQIDFEPRNLLPCFMMFATKGAK